MSKIEPLVAFKTNSNLTGTNKENSTAPNTTVCKTD